LLIVLGLFGEWLIWCEVFYESVKPAGPSLADHLARRPPATRREIVTSKGEEFLILTGESSMLPRFPSGDPVYVFDRQGKLVDWTSDNGDSPKFFERWAGLTSRRDATRDEVAAWAEQKH
jgi:hypothetical protein